MLLTRSPCFSRFRKNLSLVGLVASIDPEREGVSEAIEQARGAHVRVIMITGDYVKTAIAIARKIGILAPEDDTSDLEDIMSCEERCRSLLLLN